MPRSGRPASTPPPPAQHGAPSRNTAAGPSPPSARSQAETLRRAAVAARRGGASDEAVQPLLAARDCARRRFESQRLPGARLDAQVARVRDLQSAAAAAAAAVDEATAALRAAEECNTAAHSSLDSARGELEALRTELAESEGAELRGSGRQAHQEVRPAGAMAAALADRGAELLRSLENGGFAAQSELPEEIVARMHGLQVLILELRPPPEPDLDAALDAGMDEEDESPAAEEAEAVLDELDGIEDDNIAALQEIATRLKRARRH